MKSETTDLQNLFKLSWEEFDNPNGWVEPTTYCQLSCPGCYRGLALPNPQRSHEDLEKLQKDIDFLIQKRRIRILAIAGGEPLLYPRLNELVSYAKKKGLKVRLLTNGCVLTKKRLIELKKSGLSEVVIHIGRYQKRTNTTDEKSINNLRDNYCRLFREVDGVALNFITTITQKNFDEVPTIISFYKENSDIISRVLFTLYQDVLFKKSEEEDNKSYVGFKDLVNLVRKMYQAEPCSYLSKKMSKHEPSWLFFAPILLGNKTIGYVSSKSAEKFHRKTNGADWDSTRTTNNFNVITATDTAKITSGYAKEVIANPKNLLKKPRAQSVILINTPNQTKHGWDICDGCPDAILYNGELVPSCLLERIKAGEHIKL